MNLLKLMNRNIKKTFSDYLIYFITLCLCSSLFFTYLTLSSSKNPLIIDNYLNSINGFSKIVVALTYTISIIFLGLIYYVNNFIIKQRSKEFSIYMILGISQGKIAKIFFIETYVIGIIAVFIGCILGTIFSSFLNYFIIYYISGIFSYSLITYMDIFLQTIIYFNIVFFIIGIFNIKKLYKMTLLQVINERKITEIKKISSKKYFFYLCFTLFCFLFPFVFYRIPYFLTVLNTLPDVFSVLPTFVPFFSIYTGYYVFSYTLKLFIDNNMKIKFKNLNLLLFNNLFSRILSNIKSIATITLILVIATYALILGPITTEFSKDFFEYRLPYDLIINYQDPNTDKTLLLQEIFKENEIEIKDIALIKEYQLNNSNSSICGLTDYNKARTMNNLSPISLNSNEFSYHITNKKNIENFTKNLYEKTNKIRINKNISLSPPTNQSNAVYNEPIGEYLSYDTIIVPDEILQFLKPKYHNYYATTFQPVPLKESRKIVNLIATKLNIQDIDSINLHTLEKNKFLITSAGMYSFFIGIGIIFFIIVLTILTLQQLSDAKINKKKYGILYKIGVDKPEIYRLIDKQIFILFIIPFVFGILCSSYFIYTFYMQWKPYIYAYMGVNKFILNILFGFSISFIIFFIYYISSKSIYKKIIKNEFTAKI